MKKSHKHISRELKRVRLFGTVFVIIGICFIMHGGLNLFEIYNRESHMFALETGFTPEKGRMWSEFLAGTSVCLTGILMCIKAGIDLKKGKKSE
ncbi:MAG: hypothetical protein HF978_20735 [Desulfobacteraceae bacterium]|nr:hypothetical protein [Desulfobacteraceae bacterium]MBC2757976.1 hypothetical protein [Desulfobacteraceae bacterium]